MDSALTEIGLPIALAIIMFGLGLDLTLADFRRVGKHPKAVAIALACQLVLLPAVCFGLVVLFDLPAFLGIGMLLLAASPGGTTANLFSHLFRGDVALNISLTAINSVIAIGTLPLITNLAIDYFDKSESVSMPLDEVVKVFVLILVPTGLGMLVRAKKASFAAAMDKPVRVASAIILAVLVLGILLGEKDRVGDYLADVGIVAAMKNISSE
jgi:BASS family bile acid:Na+ symporter